MGRRVGWRLAREQLDMRRLEVSIFTTSFPFPRYSINDIAGYGPLIRTYVQFLLAKLRFHRLRPEFNGLFEYEEYITLKGIDDPNEG